MIVAGGIIFFLNSRSNKPQSDQGMVLNDIFSKKANLVSSMAIVASPAGGHETGFTIQVYSFQGRNRAETALQALKNRGYQAFLIMNDLGEKGVWYRVRVGGIADEAVARKMLDEIRKNYNSGFILKTKN